MCLMFPGCSFRFVEGTRTLGQGNNVFLLGIGWFRTRMTFWNAVEGEWLLYVNECIWYRWCCRQPKRPAHRLLERFGLRDSCWVRWLCRMPQRAAGCLARRFGLRGPQGIAGANPLLSLGFSLQFPWKLVPTVLMWVVFEAAATSGTTRFEANAGKRRVIATG
jgi:hypothetical protein